MKQILFRGKRVDNDEWVYGFLVEALNCVTDKNETFIIEQDAKGLANASKWLL